MTLPFVSGKVYSPSISLHEHFETVHIWHQVLAFGDLMCLGTQSVDIKMALLESGLSSAGQYLRNVESSAGSLGGLLQGVLILLPSNSNNTSVVAVKERI